MYFEFEDGALYSIAFGEDHAYLQRFAGYLVQHGPPGFENVGAFLEHLPQQGELKLPAKRTKLEWQADTAAVGRRYIARVGELGRIEFQKSGPGAPYGIEWTSTAGATMTLGEATRVTDAKRLSSSFAQTMLALARAREGGDAVDGDPTPAPALEWSERVEDRRTIHVAHVEGGELQLVPTLLGAHALFFQRSETDWDAIDCGRMETMKEKALEYAASRGLIKAQEPGAEPEIPSQSEAEKQAAIMGGLKSLLGEMAEDL